MTQDTQPIPLEQAQAPFFLGVDVGGTNIKIGLVDDLGRTLAFSSTKTKQQAGPADAVRRMAAACRQLTKQVGWPLDRVQAIGLGTPGTMDIPKGLILEPPNLPHWRNFPIRDRLSEACDRPVAFANDANAAAYGEFWVGSGRAHDSMIMLTLGTGVGGGIIVDGNLIDGVNSFGSECGHIIIDFSEQARQCVWGGGQGQLEAYASASAVAERTQEALDRGRSSSLQARIAAGQQLSALMVSEEAERGDALCQQIVAETARYLGIGIVSLVHTIDPGAVILGGAMDFGGHETNTGRRFLQLIRDEFRRRAFHVVADTTTIDFATLGGDAGYIGAAGIARRKYA